MTTDTFGIYLDSSLVCVPCWNGEEGEAVTVEALPNGFTCDECGVTQNV